MDYKEFWTRDNLRNIVPPTHGDKPEGWDPVEFLQETLDPLDFDSVLDFGCGHGRLCRAFRPEIYLGVDLSPVAIQKACSNHAGYRFEEIGI